MKKILIVFFVCLSLFAFVVPSFALSGSSEIFPLICPVVPWELHYINSISNTETDYPLVGSFSSPSGSGLNPGLNINTISGGPGLYSMISKRQDAVTNSQNGILALTISEVYWNRDYDYLPAIYVPDSENSKYNVWYGADPVAYASFTIRNLATDVRFNYTDVPLNILNHLDGDRYYKLSEVFVDESFPEDIQSAFSSSNWLIERFSLQLYVASSEAPGVNGNNILIKQVAVLPYINEQGVYIDPLRNYYDSVFGSLIASAKEVGYTQGYYIGTQDGIKSGYEQGKQDGYNSGYADGAAKGFDFTSFLAASLSGVMNVKMGIISIGSVVGVIIAILLIKWLLKLIGGN